VKRRLSAKIFLTGLELMRPILLPLFWVMEKTYDLLFGRSDPRSSKAQEEQLAQEVRENLPFLFDHYGGRIESDETLKHPRPFDYAVAIVSLDALSFRFFRGRGEFRVQVASNDTPRSWEDLPLVLGMIDPGFEQKEFSSFLEVEVALKPRMERLQVAFSEDRQADLRQRLSDVHDHQRAVIRQWETEIKSQVVSG
jgi:hypothetical protein